MALVWVFVVYIQLYVAELDQSSVSAIVVIRVGTDALIMITILMTQSMQSITISTMAVHEFNT